MMIRILLLVLATCLALPSPVRAGQIIPNPVITYDFAGTLDQPFNGISRFSGSLTYVNTSLNPQGASYSNSCNEQIDIFLNIGGHSVEVYSGIPTSLEPVFGDVDIQHNINFYVKGDEFTAFVYDTRNKMDTAFFGTNVSFGMYLADPSGHALPEFSPDVFEDLVLGKFATRVFDLDGTFDFVGRGPSGGYRGTITSLVNTGYAVPEPPSWALCAAGFLGLGLYRALRRLGSREGVIAR